MKSTLLIATLLFTLLGILSCSDSPSGGEKAPEAEKKAMTAADILGNPEYPAISFGGYRDTTREIQPTVEQLKEDMQILSAMGIRVLRTYHTERPHASNVLEAIHQLKQEDPEFEMYVMVGIWINCKDAFTDNPDHDGEDEETNALEVNKAVAMAKKYPDIVKVLAVGNEAMVKWQAGYHVQSGVILKWVNYLQELKANGELPEELWITSSDNFASWGGGGAEYHTEDLKKLIAAVDFVSMHTYPMHDTHYNPDFWGVIEEEAGGSKREQIEAALLRSRDYAISQYNSVVQFIDSLGIDKPIHIGETGWATASNSFYGPEGSRATDEYKSARYYDLIREWTDAQGISCFYFEAFDEPWKDAGNPGGSENHFGLFTVEGKAKYPVWEQVDRAVFEGLSRGGNPIEKTYNGDEAALLEEVLPPPVKDTIPMIEIVQ